MNKIPDWGSLVSSRVGIVTKLVPQFRNSEEPSPPFLYTATLSHFDMRYAALSERLNAGKGPTEEIAKLSAVAEAVERYCAAHIQPNVLFNASAQSLAENMITPDEFVLYSEQQYSQPGFPHPKFAQDQIVSWVRGVELTNQETVALPASQVYLFDRLMNVQGTYAPVTSNGLAAGSCKESAILSGLCELIERDAFLVTWINRLPVPEIEIPENGTCGSIRRHYHRLGVKLRTFLLRTDQLPYVVLALACESDPERPARVIGLGCDLDPGVALEKAVFELCQARPSALVRWQSNHPKDRLQSPRDVINLDDHADLYSLAENRHQFEFLWSTDEKLSLTELESPDTHDATANLERCVDRLVDTGHRVAYVDLTTSDIATTGFRVVRTIATGLQPIHFGFGQERLGGSRLFQLPVSLGILASPKTPAELNPFPHPLA